MVAREQAASALPCPALPTPPWLFVVDTGESLSAFMKRVPIGPGKEESQPAEMVNGIHRRQAPHSLH